ncbi:MAG: transglutaminase domain-containing protein [Candidatus Kapaibacteriota bacterium]
MKHIVAATFLTLSCILHIQMQEACAQNAKHIIIDSSNNLHLDDEYFYLPLPISQKKKEVQLLREYVLERIKPRTSTDIEAFADIVTWVHERWKHDGSMSPGKLSTLEILQAAETGRTFSCIEYSRVFTDILHSLGYVCRIIGVTNSDIAYGGMGVSHTLCEAWSNELNKWVMIDPQFGYMMQKKGEYLHYVELHHLLSDKSQNQIDIVSFDENSIPKKINDKSKDTYIHFIKRYNAYLLFDMKINAQEVMYVLPLHSKEQFMTSQGGNSKPLIFLSDSKDAYFNVNRSHLLFEFNIPSGDVASIVAGDSVKSQEDFQERMSRQLAIPDFTVHLTNNTPWFSHYEMKMNGETSWNKVTGHSIQVKLRDGNNVISLRTVNQAGRTGALTMMHIRYQ